MSKAKKGILVKSAAAAILLFAVSLVLQPVNAEAGERYRAWKSPEKAVERLRDRLDLTEDQVSDVKPVMENSIKKHSEIISRYREQRRELKDSMRNEMLTVRSETDEQLSKILSDEQMQEFQSLKKERRKNVQKHKSRHGSRGY